MHFPIWIIKIFGFISPTQAQAAHIRQLEAELRQRDSLISDLMVTKRNLETQLSDEKNAHAVTNTEKRKLAEEFDSFKKLHSSRPIVYPKNGIV